MIFTFFSAYYDDETTIEGEKSKICKRYLCGWFTIDFLSIFPFEAILASGDFAGLVRIFRVSKIYKIVKIARLVRIFKFMKQRKNFGKSTDKVLKVDAGVERLFFFLFIAMISMHICTCLWITITKIDPRVVNWITEGDYENHSVSQLYVASWYFVVTTFTTVGFGDIRAYNTGERTFAILLMIVGVLGFTFATGALSSILTSMEHKHARLKEKKTVLDRMKQRYSINDDLY